MIRVVFVLWIVCLSHFQLDAQTATDSLRSSNIQYYPDHFFVWPVFKYRTLFFEIRNGEEGRHKVFFRPNSAATLGAGFYLFEVAIELGFTMPIDERSRKVYGQTTSRDLQLNVLAKSWGIDVYSQRYSGFYKDDNRINISGAEIFPQRPDVKTRNFGALSFYVLNHRKFSLRSAYNFIDRQKESGGSVILFGTLNTFKVEADSSLLSGKALQGFGEGSDFKTLQYTSLSIGPGYSYNFILKKFFLNGTFSVGPAHHWVYYVEAQGAERYDININATYFVRFAVGYNSDRFFGGIGFSSQSRVVNFESVRFENASQTVRLVAGYRFKEKGILKKRAWDFIPKP
jgi:hypothetical protein